MMTTNPKGQKVGHIRQTKRKDKAHLAYVAQQPCCISGHWPVVVHHLMERFPDKIGRRDYKYTIPLAPEFHNNARGVHGSERNDKTISVEKDFLNRHGVNGGELAAKLWSESHG